MQLNEKLLLIDFQNLATRMVFRVAAQADKSGDFIKPYDFRFETYLRKLWFNETLGYICKFMSELVNRHLTVMAVDSQNIWRKEIYKDYKNNRAKYRDKTGERINWESAFELYEEFIDLMRRTPAVLTLQVKLCEADDIIGALILNNSETDNIIISTDSDFKQLADRATVYQDFENLQKNTRFTEEEANEFLVSKILLGDTSDTIPNVIRGVGEKTVAKFIQQEGVEQVVRFIIDKYKEKFPLCLHDYKRNRALIDLKRIPETLQKQILATYRMKKQDYNKDFEPIVKFAEENGLNHFNQELVCAKMRLMYG